MLAMPLQHWATHFNEAARRRVHLQHSAMAAARSHAAAVNSATMGYSAHFFAARNTGANDHLGESLCLVAAQVRAATPLWSRPTALRCELHRVTRRLR